MAVAYLRYLYLVVVVGPAASAAYLGRGLGRPWAVHGNASIKSLLAAEDVLGANFTADSLSREDPIRSLDFRSTIQYDD